jgi:Bacterial PH domain
MSENLSILQQSVEYQLQGELAPGERLLWSGRPRGGIVFTATDAYRIPFSLLFLGISVFWQALTIWAGEDLTFALLTGLPFLIFGLYMGFGRFPVDARRRNRTYYALTDRRVIIVSGLVSRETQSLSLRNLPNLVLDSKPDGSGTITFGDTNPLTAMYGSFYGKVFLGPGVPAFEMIENARHVYDLILQAQMEVTFPYLASQAAWYRSA